MPIPSLSKPSGRHAHEMHETASGTMMQRSLKKVLVVSCAVVFLSIVTVGITFAMPLFNIWKLKKELPSLATGLTAALRDGTSEEVLEQYGELRNAIRQGGESYEKFAAAIPLPLRLHTKMGKAYESGRVSIQVVNRTLEDAEPLIPLVKEGIEVFGVQSSEKSVRDARRRYVTALSRRSQELNKVRDDLTALSGALNSLPPFLSQRIFGGSNVPAKIAQVADASHTVALLAVLGEHIEREDPFRILTLIQNSSELRPTGGLISTYALAQVSQGEIINFSTDDIYNLDSKHIGSFKDPAPLPLQKYARQEVLYMRDTNWSPDFPTSAASALEYWKREGGAQPIHMVIGVTPQVVTSLISILGPVNIFNTMLESHDFVATLQEEVEITYRDRGIKKQDRKDLIGDIGRELIGRLHGADAESLLRLAASIYQASRQKDVQVFLPKQEAQAVVQEAGWSGALSPPGAMDVVMVVDANMLALKTDAVIKREIAYLLDAEDENTPPVATLALTYRHTGTPDWKTSAYRTYTRIYTNGGSLRSVEGNSDEQGKSTKVDAYEELGFVVFGAYTTVAPETEKTMRFKYVITNPAVIKSIRDGTYALRVERQAGSGEPRVSLDLKLPKKASMFLTPQSQQFAPTFHFTHALPLTETMVLSQQD